MSRTRRAILTLTLLALLVVQPVAAAGLGTTAPTTSASSASAASMNTPEDPCLARDVVATVIIPGYDAVECNGLRAETVANLSAQETNETKLNIHTAAQTTEAKDETWIAGLQNFMNQTRSGALQEAQNALIRSYTNGSSIPEAKAEGRQAVNDYYAAQQVQVLNMWSVYAEEFANFQTTIRSDAGINSGWGPTVEQPYAGLDGVGSSYNAGLNGGESATHYWYANFGQEAGTALVDVTLINNTQHQVSALPLSYTVWTNGDNSNNDYNDYYGFNVTWNPTKKIDYSDEYTQHADQQSGDTQVDQDFLKIPEFKVYGPNLNLGLGQFEYIDPKVYARLNDRLLAQQQEVINEFNGFADPLITAIDTGEITKADAINPYLALEEYSTEERNASMLEFSALLLQQLGINTPENMDGLGSMTIRDETTGTNGTLYEGLLLSDSSPAGGFDVNTTYDAANISGLQYVVTDSEQIGQVELTGNFTILSATGTDGSSIQNLQYRDTSTTQTSSIQAYQERQDEIRETLAEINARQQALLNTSGGGGGGLNLNIGWPSLGSLPRGAVLIVVAFAAVLVFQLLSN